MTTILKVGGSVITDKATPETVDTERLEAVSSVIGQHGADDLILVHGGGSFGHEAAAAANITTERGSTDPTAIRSVTDAMNRLNDAVVEALIEGGTAAVGLSPRALAVQTDDGELDIAPGAIAGLLAHDLTPVLHGDLIVHPDRGMTVVSGDRIVVALARVLEAERIGFCTGVPGVLDETETVVPTISSAADVEDYLTSPDGTDVTGGMLTKVNAMLSLDVPGAIFGIDSLETFLTSGLPGTTVRGSAEGDAGTF